MSTLFDSDILTITKAEKSCAYIGTVVKEIKIDLDIAKFLFEKRMEVWGSETRPYVFDFSKVKTATPEAADFFSSDYTMERINALALVARNRLHLVGIKFWIRFAKPRAAIQTFKKVPAALQWTNGFC